MPSEATSDIGSIRSIEGLLGSIGVSGVYWGAGGSVGAQEPAGV